MRLAALYDIHGNLPALEATLRDVHAVGVDAVVVGGDVLPGPMPRETLACLAALDVPVHFIHGNGDRIVATYLAGGDISEVPEGFRDTIAWTADQLEPAQRAAVASWPPFCQLIAAGVGPTFFCHATARNDTECFTRTTPSERLELVFAGVEASVVVCGHTHMQFDRTLARHRVVNAGSVGMPFSAPRGAYWLLLADGLHLRRTAYDVEAAAERLRATSCPRVEELAVRYVLNPPSEADSLRMFSAIELRS